MDDEEPEPKPEPKPMLDPSWTPAKGYAHALEILARLNREAGV